MNYKMGHLESPYAQARGKTSWPFQDLSKNAHQAASAHSSQRARICHVRVLQAVRDHGPANLPERTHVGRLRGRGLETEKLAHLRDGARALRLVVEAEAQSHELCLVRQQDLAHELLQLV